MFKILQKLMFVFLLVLPATVLSIGNVRAQEDEVDNDDPMVDDHEATVDDESDDSDDEKVDDAEEDLQDTTEEEKVPQGSRSEAADEEDEKEPESLKPSPDADAVILFIKPGNQKFLAGEIISCLVGFSNNGKLDFIVHMMDVSLRYPQDYTYYIQNFTASPYNYLVQPGQEVSFEYAFKPHESFGGRQFGLSINLLYKNVEGKDFMDSVFNETITLTESDEGLDGETFFLYLFLAAVGLLLVLGAHYAFTSVKGKKTSTKPVIEMGTQQKTDIDYDWLPKETTEFISGKNSPRRSPRNRRQKRNTGSDE